MHVAAMTSNIAALDKLLAAGARRGCLDKVHLPSFTVHLLIVLTMPALLCALPL